MTPKNSELTRTLIVLKPDAVKRALVGKILSRIEDAGLKIIACRMQVIDRDFAKKHYFDVAERRGGHVLEMLLDFITSGPVIALCVEGVEAADNVRRLVGGTEPKSAAPGTIRGDYCHVSYKFSDSTGRAIQNLIHASGNQKEAEYELNLWFSSEEYMNYKGAQEEFTHA